MDALQVEIILGFDPVAYYEVWECFGEHPISRRFRYISDADTLRFINAFEGNIIKVAEHYKEPVSEWRKYAIEKAGKMEGFTIPLEFYRNLYNISLELLNEIK